MPAELLGDETRELCGCILSRAASQNEKPGTLCLLAMYDDPYGDSPQNTVLCLAQLIIATEGWNFCRHDSFLRRGLCIQLYRHAAARIIARHRIWHIRNSCISGMAIIRSPAAKVLVSPSVQMSSPRTLT